jgi:glycine/D-amino acid oxidase-like deaminating enzyme
MDGVMQPLARARALARDAVAAGAVLHGSTRAVSVAGAQVVTDRGRISARRVIVAVDGRLELLLPELEPRVRTARLQMLATAPAGDVSITRPVYWRDGYEYWQQLPDGSIALGGFRDTAIDDEWTHDAVPSAPIQHPICEVVRDGVFAIGAYSGTGNVVGALCARDAATWALAELGH